MPRDNYLCVRYRERTCPHSKDETDEEVLPSLEESSDSSTNPDPEETNKIEKTESEPSDDDSSDNPPDMNASPSSGLLSPDKEASPSEKLKTRIAQTENPVLRTKLLKIQSMHNEINLLTNPEELTKKYLATNPADLMDDNSLDDGNEEVYDSNNSNDSNDTDSNGNLSLEKFTLIERNLL